eukprot:4888465-Pyramimonas_sp.AAC.1
METRILDGRRREPDAAGVSRFLAVARRALSTWRPRPTTRRSRTTMKKSWRRGSRRTAARSRGALTEPDYDEQHHSQRHRQRYGDYFYVHAMAIAQRKAT